MDKKFFIYLLITLIIFNLAWLIFILSFNLSVFHSKDFYTQEFTKLGVYNALKGYDVDKINNEVLDYLKNKKDSIESDFFTQREKDHLLDVKNIIQSILFSFYIVFMIIIILLILLFFIIKKNYKNYWKQFLYFLAISFIGGGLLNIFIQLLLFGMIYFDFDYIFEMIHISLFNKGSYVFNPALEKIVILYPHEFFIAITIEIVKYSIYFNIGSIIIGTILFFKQRSDNKLSTN